MFPSLSPSSIVISRQQILFTFPCVSFFPFHAAEPSLCHYLFISVPLLFYNHHLPIPLPCTTVCPPLSKWQGEKRWPSLIVIIKLRLVKCFKETNLATLLGECRWSNLENQEKQNTSQTCNEEWMACQMIKHHLRPPSTHPSSWKSELEGLLSSNPTSASK